MTEVLAHRRFPAQSSELQAMRKDLRTILIKQVADQKLLDKIILAITEACSNIIQHAYGNNFNGDIILETMLEDQELVFRLIDFAPIVDKSKWQPRDLNDLRPGGLGVYFIQSVMDDCRFLEPEDGIGNILELRVNKG